MIGIYIFIGLYLLTLGLYFYTETSGNMKLRAPNKVVLTVSFFTFAVVMFFTKPRFAGLNGLAPSTTFHIVLIVALWLSMMGDIFLLFNINRGGDFFLAGNIAFFAYYCALFALNGVSFAAWWWVIPVAILLTATWAFLFYKYPNRFRLGKMKGPMILYLSTIILHGVMAVAALIFLGGQFLWAIFLSVGSILFMISDQILTIDYFVFPGRKWLLRMNSLFYFVGMLLIVLSMVF
ncbi:MAG: lysoplasmalogenase [Candidatus Cloacimonetes bacterium]|nr:lysoplasmalogenase [Candidatus Cloacimonadota bacterium]